MDNFSGNNLSFDAYKLLVDQITNTFCNPKVLVVASDLAKTLCHMNHLTPAEFFTPFGRDPKMKPESGYQIEQKSEFQSETLPYFTVKYSKVEFIDIEEWQPLSKETLQATFQNTLERNEPNIENILQIKNEDVESRPRRVLKVFGWDEACNFTSEYLKTMAKEYEWNNLNECQAILYVLSFEDQLDKKIIELNQKYNKTFADATGENPLESKSKIIRLFVVLRSGEIDVVNNLDHEEADKRINQTIKNVYKADAIWININDRDQKNPNVQNYWKDEYFNSKRVIKSYEYDGTKVASNTKNLQRGHLIDMNSLNVTEGKLKVMFTSGLGAKLNSLAIKRWEMGFQYKKTVKKGFMGLTMFKKEEKAYFTKEGKYIFTDVEKEVKRLADLLMVCGMIELAKEEYLYIIENLSKKNPETSNSINEMIMYCSLAIPNKERPGFPKEKMKHVNKNMQEYLLKSMSNSNNNFRYARLLVVMNLINHVYFDGNEAPKISP